MLCGKEPGLNCSTTLSPAWPPKRVEGEEGHSSQGGTLGLLPRPLLPQAGDHLLSGPGPVAREKPLFAANMNDPPPAPPPPNFKVSLPGVWLQFANKPSGSGSLTWAWAAVRAAGGTRVSRLCESVVSPCLRESVGEHREAVCHGI